MTRERVPPADVPDAADVPDVQSSVYDRRSSARTKQPVANPEFDPITVSLDPGISLVEASAGTGKTFCITITVLRLLLDRDDRGEYRVDGIGRVLVVTFTNAATAELITRVRAALRDAVEIFSGVVVQRTEANTPLFELLDTYGAGELPRLRQALASLDQLSIFTIHGFCKRVLEESALESGTPYDAIFLEDDAQLVDRVAQDWWRRTIYEDELLAALAVHDEWGFDDFLKDFMAWRRWPETRLEPDEELPAAVERVKGAVAQFGKIWNPTHARAFLDSLNWRKNATLAQAAARATVVASGTALAGGDVPAGLAFIECCTTAAIHDGDTGIKVSPKALFAQVPLEPFVRAADAISDAFEGVHRALRVSCLREVNSGFDSEKRRHHLLGFDDLLRRLKEALEREGPDGHLATAIRRRYDAALIDEFQDTDAFQFPIFSTAFSGRPLFLIGDPKQAIYGFRGADVFAYMQAVECADRRYTLTRNWRSTTRMVSAVNALFGRNTNAFLYDRIPFVNARAAREPADSLHGDGKCALHWWFVPPDEAAKPVAKGNANSLLNASMAREIVRLIRPSAEGGRQMPPGNMAVLVRTGREGRDVERVLRSANVPCIVAGLGDILESHELKELECVLAAVAAPQDVRAVRAALTTEMWGMDAAGIHGLSQPEHEHDWQRLAERLGQARESWLRHGFMRMVQELIVAGGIPERLLTFDDGERRLTNLRHAVELLHAVTAEERLSPEGLLLWIARARSRESEDSDRTELRLDADDDAVQIVTIHKSKGLEYDVVFCPTLWGVWGTSSNEAVLVHLSDGSVVFDHGSPQRTARGRIQNAERLAEDIRLAYVAMTRARLRCYVGWGAISGKKSNTGAWASGLGYLLRAENATGEPEEIAEQVAESEGSSLASWEATLKELVSQNADCMSMEVLDGRFEPAQPWHGVSASVTEPHCRPFLPAAEQLRTWRVSSFTSLTAGQHVEDARDLSDQAHVTGHLLTGIPEQPEDRSDFMAFPAGRRAGVVLHELFERLDFAATPVQMRQLTGEILCRERMATDDADPRIAAVAGMARRVIDTKLPGATFALSDVPVTATLREWKFHLPLGSIQRGTLGRIFDAHGGELAHRYVAALRSVAPERTYGFLTGVVDLVFQQDNRWYVLDWKSNHLGVDPVNYDADGLEQEMFASQYVLQYHLYVTALHRFLRMRLPGYDYAQHMGGVWYAFLRGIDGSERGWYRDRPPRTLIDALDALMDSSTMQTTGGTAA